MRSHQGGQSLMGDEELIHQCCEHLILCQQERLKVCFKKKCCLFPMKHWFPSTERELYLGRS